MEGPAPLAVPELLPQAQTLSAITLGICPQRLPESFLHPGGSP